MSELSDAVDAFAAPRDEVTKAPRLKVDLWIDNCDDDEVRSAVVRKLRDPAVGQRTLSRMFSDVLDVQIGADPIATWRRRNGIPTR